MIMRTREEMMQVYRECYPQYSDEIISAMVDCYYDGAKDVVESYKKVIS